MSFRRALGELYESQASLQVAAAWGYITEAQAQVVVSELTTLGGRLYGLSRRERASRQGFPQWLRRLMLTLKHQLIQGRKRWLLQLQALMRWQASDSGAAAESTVADDPTLGQQIRAARLLTMPW